MKLGSMLAGWFTFGAALHYTGAPWWGVALAFAFVIFVNVVDVALSVALDNRRERDRQRAIRGAVAEAVRVERVEGGPPCPSSN